MGSRYSGRSVGILGELSSLAKAIFQSQREKFCANQNLIMKGIRGVANVVHTTQFHSTGESYEQSLVSYTLRLPIGTIDRLRLCRQSLFVHL